MITSQVSDGCSYGPGRCVLIVQPHDTEDSDRAFASIFLVVNDGKVQSALFPGFIVSCLVEHMEQIFLIGQLGEVARLQGNQLIREDIEGTDDFGFLTGACAFGERLYVVGMRRQVYARRNTCIWSRIDTGVLDDSNDVERVSGFRSIDACSIDNAYAVGLDGEIWNRRGEIWCPVDSPTDAILEQVRCTPQGNVYAAGQSGVIVRGLDAAWEVIEQADTQDDFWGLEWFRGSLYLATHSQLFKLEGPDALKNVSIENGASFCRLRAGHGALWSFGPEEVRWSVDGDTWIDVTIPKAHAGA